MAIFPRFPMIPISEATEIIEREARYLGVERVVLDEIVGRVLAEDIRADMDLPPFDRSQMDGFALRSDDVSAAPAALKILGESVAGKGWDGEISGGGAVRIMTGAPVPRGADSVQKVELTAETDGIVRIEEPTRPVQNIVKRGEEIESGDLVIEKSEVIAPNMVASLAAFGYDNVEVAIRPRVKILSTGSEIVDISSTPDRDQIRNSNSWMLRAFADKYADVTVLPIAKDDLESLISTIEGAGKETDILIISGGVSVGDYDFTKPALRKLGAKIFFEKVSLKPGKPTVFAKLGETLIFGLPGNPVSSAVTYFLFVQVAILKMQGARRVHLRKGFAQLTHELRGKKERDSFLPVRVETNENGALVIETFRFSGSSNFIRFALANALVWVPRGESFEKGEVAEIRFL